MCCLHVCVRVILRCWCPPSCPCLHPAIYNNGSLVATQCQVSVAHVSVTCLTAPGVGTGHAWQLQIAGQWSNVYLHDFGGGVMGTGYAAPTIAYFEYSADTNKGVKGGCAHEVCL